MLIANCRLTAEQRRQQSCTTPDVSTVAEALKVRTRRFALDVLRMIEDLPATESGRVIRLQLAKSATSVAANYRATCHAQSRKHFIAKLQLVLEEAGETQTWLELIAHSGWLPAARISRLSVECGELVAIFTTSIKTARSHLRD
jgi:four helix bundle protein